MTSIGQKAFEDCTGLTSVHISDLSTWHNITFGTIGVGGNPLEYAHHLYLNGDEIENLIIPNDVTSINDRAFSGCTGLTSVTIPNSVTSIGNNVFSGCSGLTSVTIPNSIISIGKWVFYECSGLTSVTIPNSVTTIGDSAFRNCSGMTSITIPESVTSIGEYVFESCSSLISVIIPNSLKFINYRAFYGCSGLTSVTIPDSVTCIGDYAFENCISLSSITIPNNCSIEYRAFYGCSNLTSVTIGSGCRLLFEKIFANCQKLTDVYCYAVQVPPTSHNVFLDSNIENATLHVPAESIELYKTTLPWSNFGTIVALDGDTPKSNKCATPTISYANGKLKFNCETDDVLFNPTIKNDDIKPYNHTEEIDLCVTYQISV